MLDDINIARLKSTFNLQKQLGRGSEIQLNNSVANVKPKTKLIITKQ